MNGNDGSALTKQRRAVLQVIQDSEEHMTASEVFDCARQILPGISFATVYNSLRYLKQEGLIGEVRFGTGAARFDGKLGRHDHAICNQCGKLIDLDVPIPDELIEEGARLSAFQVESIELTLRGLCPNCKP